MSSNRSSAGCMYCGRSTFHTRRAQLRYYLNALLLAGSFVGIAISIAAVVTLEQTEDYGILGFAKWAPMVFSTVAFIFALIMTLRNFGKEIFLVKVLYAIVMGLMVICIFISGIVFILYATNSETAAYSDSRTVGEGVASELRVQANDRAMALWNTCCAGIYADDDSFEVKSCTSSDPCKGQSGFCACYQSTSLYNSLRPIASDCAYLRKYEVVVNEQGHNDVVPLVGANSTSCAGGNPKLFQQYLNELIRRQTVTLGSVFLAVGFLISFFVVCFIDMILNTPSEVKGNKSNKVLEKVYESPKPETFEADSDHKYHSRGKYIETV